MVVGGAYLAGARRLARRGLACAHRLSPLRRLSLLCAALPFQALFGIFLTSSTTVIGGDFYRSLALPFVPDLLADQRSTAAIVWALGEIPIVVVLIALAKAAFTDAPRPARSTRRPNQVGDNDNLT